MTSTGKITLAALAGILAYGILKGKRAFDAIGLLKYNPVGIKIDSVQLTNIRTTLRLEISNPSEISLPLDFLDMQFFNPRTGSQIAEIKNWGVNKTIAAFSTTALDIPVNISPLSLGLDAFSFLRTWLNSGKKEAMKQVPKKLNTTYTMRSVGMEFTGKDYVPLTF